MKKLAIAAAFIAAVAILKSTGIGDFLAHLLIDPGSAIPSVEINP